MSHIINDILQLENEIIKKVNAKENYQGMEVFEENWIHQSYMLSSEKSLSQLQTLVRF